PLLAPAVFNSVIEYPLAILLACLLLPRTNKRSAPTKETEPAWQNEVTQPKPQRTHALDLIMPVGIGTLTILLALVADRYVSDYMQTLAVAVGVPLIVSYQFRRRPLRFALALAAVMLATGLQPQLNTHMLYTARHFFGVL